MIQKQQPIQGKSGQGEREVKRIRSRMGIGTWELRRRERLNPRDLGTQNLLPSRRGGGEDNA